MATRSAIGRLAPALVTVLALSAPSAAAPPHAGSLDRSFGRNGRLVFNLPGEPMRPRAMVVQPDGKIVVAGHLTDSPNVHPGWVFGRALVVRFLPDGALDATFGDGGVARVRLRSPVAIDTVAIQPDSALLLGGTALGDDPGENLGAVARLLPSGAVDGSFGSGGLATLRAENVDSYPLDVRALSHLGFSPTGASSRPGRSGRTTCTAPRIRSSCACCRTARLTRALTATARRAPAVLIRAPCSRTRMAT